jgi:hypothetical protein
MIWMQRLRRVFDIDISTGMFSMSPYRRWLNRQQVAVME